MLANDPELEGVPFLFMSDHDPHAMEIYSTLKHGSRATAFTTKITNCWRLDWAGATIEFFERMARSYPVNEVERRIQAKVIQEADRARVLQELEIEVTSKMMSRLTSGRGRLTKPDKRRMKHFFRYEIFSDKYDQKLYKDLQEMGMNAFGSVKKVRKDAPGKV